MSLTIKDILSFYKHGTTYLLSGTKVKFLVAMGTPNKAVSPIQDEGIKQYIATFLMDRVDLNTRDSNGNTILHIAINLGMLEVARSIIQDGGDIHAINRWGSTPLHAATSSYNADCVELLLEHDANPNAKDNYGRSPVDIAFESGTPEIQDIITYFNIGVLLH